MAFLGESNGLVHRLFTRNGLLSLYVFALTSLSSQLLCLVLPWELGFPSEAMELQPTFIEDKKEGEMMLDV